MCLALRKCYNKKILSNHPMKPCPFWGISDRNLKFRYLKPQVNIWKCKINIEDIPAWMKFFTKFSPINSSLGIVFYKLLNFNNCSTNKKLFFFSPESRHKIKDFYKQSSFPQTFSIHPTSSIQRYVVWFVYISFIRLN